MAEYIEREAAVAAAFSATSLGNSAFRDVYDTVNRLRLIPAADVQPVLHGRWTDKRTMEHDGEWYCSVCGKEITIYMGPERPDRYRYCPNCGAKMDKEEHQCRDN